MIYLKQAAAAIILSLVLAANSKATTYEIRFNENDLELKRDQYGEIIKIEGCHLSGDPGNPFLPVKTGHIAAPFGTEVTDIRIVHETWTTLPGTYDIRPAPIPVPISYEGPLPKIFRNAEIYSSDEPYPAQALEFSGGGLMRGYALGGFKINPLRYYPLSGRLEFLEAIEVEVEYTFSTSQFQPSVEFGSAIARLVINPSEVEYEPIILSPVHPEDVKYLIITTANLSASFQPLADWYTQSGFPAEIINYSTIQSNYSGATAQLKTKTCIQDYAINKGTIFVLLGGDDMVVPDQNCLADAGSEVDNTMPTDLFFACFDNRFDWNSDGDNQVGEYTDGMDLYPEVFISRAPVRTPDQALNFVNKNLNYILNQPADGFVDPMLLSGLQLWETWAGRSDADWRCERLWNSYAAPAWQGHSRVRLYDTNTDFGGSSYDVTYQNLSTILNNGYHYFFMATHGSQTTWSMETGYSFNPSHALSLTNYDAQGVIYTIACITNGFDSEGGYYSDPCLSEAFIRNANGGAVVYQGCSRYGWGMPGQTDEHGVSFQYADEFFTYLFSGDSYQIPEGYPYRMGAVAASHKAAKVPECNDGIVRWVNYGTNSIGDPGLDLYTENPLTMYPTYPDSVYLGPSDFTIGNLPEDARVCLWKGDEVYAVGTETGGSATLPVLPTSTGNITVTITAHNYFPNIGQVRTAVPQAACVVCDTFTVNDSGGNNDHRFDFGENISLGMRLQNIGLDTAYDVRAKLLTGDPYITITDSTEEFGTIIGGFGNLNIDNAYQLDISTNIPDGHLIQFEIEITGNLIDTLIDRFFVYAHAPIVSITELIVNDATGNGNGMIDAGETVDLYLTLINTGSSQASSVAGTISEDDEHIIITDATGSFGNLIPSGGTGSNWNDAFIVTADTSFPSGYSANIELNLTAEGGYSKNLRFNLESLESFEYSDAGWTSEPVWEWGAPSSGPGQAYDGNNVWATVLNGNYPDGADCELLTPYYTITDSSAFMSFYHWYRTQIADGGNVQITSDGGWTWELAVPNNGYSRPHVTALNNQPGFSGESMTWKHAFINLSEYFGQTIKIKFRFASDFFMNLDGWYLDGFVFCGGYRWEPDSLPSASCEQTSYNLYMVQGTTCDVPLTISNSGSGILEFATSISSAGNIAAIRPYNGLITEFGGPDEYGYTWVDSRENNGPVFNWVDISSRGIEIDSLVDDINVGPFNIGFEFPLYGNTFETFRVCSNGFITFTSIYANSYNRSIPTNGIEPFNLIAPFWENFDFNAGGQAFYYSTAESLIISYIDVPLVSDPNASMTFQIILLDDGSIIFQYADLSGQINSATVGIQNQNGSIGTQIAFNETYLESNLAVQICPPISWLTATPGCGFVFPDDAFNITLTFDASELDLDQYLAEISITTNDVEHPSFVIPCTLSVGLTGIDDEHNPAIPSAFMLHQNYPNPFNPTTIISFSLSASGHTSLDVYDILGRKVVTLVDDDLQPGNHSIAWDGNDQNRQPVSSGTYFYRLLQGDNISARKMMLLK